MDFTQFLTPERYNKLKNVVEKRHTDTIVVLENIIDPHNLSACLRSCDATGIMKVYLIYDGSQPYPKLSNTSSASASKWIEIVKFNSVEECFIDLKRDGYTIMTTAMNSDATSLYEINFTKTIALVFGNEHFGVSDKALGLADGNFLIPQVGMIQSLNISVACAVSVYESYRQRNLAKLYDSPQLSNDEMILKLNQWSARK
ncbi:MAG TPA: RNA methyltransferase [Candidatus Kapabacteria bacterium]|nr:RNA methyltransferase [Candidatus Kapabacteria bacterium]